LRKIYEDLEVRREEHTELPQNDQLSVSICVGGSRSSFPIHQAARWVLPYRQENTPTFHSL